VIDEAAVDGGPIRSALAKIARPEQAAIKSARGGMQLRMVNQSVVNRIEREFEAVGDAELIEDVVQMVFDGLFGDEKFFADLFISEALSDKLHDFLLAVAEKRLFAARAGFRGFGKSLHDLGGHTVIEPDFAGVHAVNALYQKIGGGLFQDHAAGAKAHGANHVTIVFGGGQNDNARGQRIEIHFLEHGKAVFVRHAQIKEKNVGLKLGEKLDALDAVLCFADDGDVFVGVEEFPQTIAKDGVIVG